MDNKLAIIIDRAPIVEILNENTAQGKRIYLEGTYLQSNIRNKNGRIYPKGIMEASVEKYVNEHIVNRRSAWGELDHPRDPKDAAYISSKNISHRITELSWNGDNVEGKAVVIKEGMGLIVTAMLEAGGDIGMSSRGMGSVVKRNGYVEVQKDLRFITAADIVTNPSAPDAWVNGIMECADFVTKSGVWSEEEIAEVQKEIRGISSVDKAEVAARQMEAIEKFLKSLV